MCVCVCGRGGGQEVRGEEAAIAGEEKRSTRCIGSGRSCKQWAISECHEQRGGTSSARGANARI